MKKYISTIVALVLLASFTACGVPTLPTPAETSVASVASEPVSEPKVSSVVEETTSLVEESETSVAEVEPVSVDTGELSETWESYELLLDGVVYAFPTTFDTFTANGWTIDSGAAGASLPSNTVTSVEFTKGDAKITLHAVNSGSSALDIEDCACIGINFDKWKIGSIPFAVPGGFTLGSARKDIVAAWGEPREGTTLANYGPAAQTYQITYYEDTLNGIRIYVK